MHHIKDIIEQNASHYKQLTNHNYMIYNGASIFKKDFNLYGYEDIDQEESQKKILYAFESAYQEEIESTLARAGIEFVKLDYYSPKAYNFEGDSIDLYATIKDRKILESYIKTNEQELQKMLDDNKSYDGYMALTPDTVEELLAEVNEVSIIVVQHILKDIDTENFEVSDHFHYDDDNTYNV